MDDKLRLKLVQLATEGYPKFRASDFEFHLPRPSYTVHTLDALKRTYPQHTFHLVIGSGQLEAVPPLVRVGTHYCRKSSSGLSPSRLSGRGHLLPQNVRTVSSPVFEISSTFIRRAIEEEKTYATSCIRLCAMNSNGCRMNL